MSDFKVGEIVDVTIKGGRVTDVHEHSGVVHVETEWGAFLTYGPADGQVTAERKDPAEWPPRPGDLWCNRKGVPWFAVATATGVRLTSKGGVASLPNDILRERGPLALVHREEAS